MTPLPTSSLHQPRTSIEQLIFDLAFDPEPPQSIDTIKQAIWLYVALLFHAHPRTGRFLLEPEKLSLMTGYSEPTIRSWLGHLRKRSVVGLSRRHGQIEVSISNWRPLSTGRPVDPRDSGVRPARAETAKMFSARDNPLTPHEVDALRAFAHTMAAMLNDQENRSAYEELVRQYDPALLKTTLQRVMAVPADKIKKSRAALFRYLLLRADRSTIHQSTS